MVALLKVYDKLDTMEVCAVLVPSSFYCKIAKVARRIVQLLLNIFFSPLNMVNAGFLLVYSLILK